MKVMAMYLPQYHEVKENNEWWGKGYTEWNAVRNAKSLFKGHIQPRAPYNANYYDLADPEAKTWAWQASLAKKYGVYGFCIYHYWFKDGRQLLEKPMEILLKHPEIDLHYSICWANETWRSSWYDQTYKVLLEQSYGDENEWIKHFNYLLQFFKDQRYIKINNKPIINIYRTFEIDNFSEMKKCWEKLAKENGFDGLFYVSGTGMHGMDNREGLFDAYYDFEPGFSLVHNLSHIKRAAYKAKGVGNHVLNKILGTKKLERKINIKWLNSATIHFLDSNQKGEKKTVFPGVCPMWDNTPRRGYLGFVTTGATPQVFNQQLHKLSAYTKEPPLDFVYINAWNEWGEGTYLEPDEYYNFGYLEAIKEVIG